MAQYLLIFIAFLIAFQNAPSPPLSYAASDPIISVLLTLIALCLAPIPAVLFARWVYRKSFARTLHLHSRAYSVYRTLSSFFLLAVFAAVIFLFSWGSFVDDSIGLHRLVTFHRLLWFPPIALLLLLSDLLRLLPFLLMLLLAWVPLYRVDLIVQRGSWTLADYIVFHLRQYVLFLLIPFSILLLLEDLWLVFPYELRHRLVASHAIYFISALLLALALFFLPLLLRFVWKTRPLPAGPLLTRLESLLAATSLRCRRILLWETYGGQLINACVTGFLRHTRYILLTDSLISSLTPDEVAAVFAHEIAHVKRHHLLFYLCSILGFILIGPLPSELLYRLPHGHLLQPIWLTLAFILYWGVAFGYFSRRMELEADLDAVALCGSTFDLVNALEKMALASGRSRAARSWRHFSIARRVEVLTTVLGDPAATLALRRRFFLLKIASITLAALAILTLAFYPALLKTLLS